ncbi:MAG: NAD-glutamate dehydrogenase domain-containing protein, partial [Gemmatimonadota bacterium]
QKESFTVAGIGDMSGDVFGNGMLLSKKIRLVAAFDHRHVFLDPDPDPGASWEERKRLFEMQRSTWDDYDRSLLSDGGMIVSRGAKEVELTPEVRRVLGIDDASGDETGDGGGGDPEGDEGDAGADQEGDPDAADTTILDGEALIRAVLRAPVELLWNGGIGTYVKASGETHADVGDPPNDAVRVDASDLRCEIVGEGGNLGFTQKARVEYALAGGRLNTDALDNSGGVDLSDREVNLKILLNPAVKDRVMSMDDRTELLRELTDSVAEQVVEDNRSQSLAISLDERRAADGLDHFRDLMSSLEREGILDRAAEDLPSWEELVERREGGGTLTRPELCVLLAYSKLHVMGRLLESGLPDEEATLPYLLEYFPTAARKAAGEDHLEAHRLRREIVSSQLTNDLVDLMGATFVHRVARDSGEDPARVAWAWVVAARLAGHRRLVGDLEERAGDFPIEVAYRWLLGLSRLLARSSRWVLANVEAGRPAGEVVRENREGLASLRESFPALVRGDDREIFEDRVSELRRVGADEGFARELITLRFLDQLLEILRVARGADADPEDAARAFYRASELLNLSWLRRNIFEVAESDRWEQRTAQALVEDLTKAQRAIAQRLVATAAIDGRSGAPGPAEILDGTRKLSRFRSLVDEIQGDGEVTLAGLSVLVREISALAAEI